MALYSNGWSPSLKTSSSYDAMTSAVSASRYDDYLEQHQQQIEDEEQNYAYHHPYPEHRQPYVLQQHQHQHQQSYRHPHPTQQPLPQRTAIAAAPSSYGSVGALPGRTRRRRKQKSSMATSIPKRKSTKTVWVRFYIKWIQPIVIHPSASLFVAILLWYSLGVVSIASSKVLLTPYPDHESIQQLLEQQRQQQPSQHRQLLLHSEQELVKQYYHHIGGVPPLVLTLQQLFLGSTLLRFLLSMRFMGSPGLQPYVSLVSSTEKSSPSTSSSLSSSSPSTQRQQLLQNQQQRLNGATTIQNVSWMTYRLLLQPSTQSLFLAGICFAMGFLATNFGFGGASAAFVETIKAAEPITSATVAVWWKIEQLSQREVLSLAGLVVGVILSTVGNASSSSSSSTNDDDQNNINDTMTTPLISSVLSCTIIMIANLCFSFRGLYQKLFRATHPASVVDDLNLQFRMQQLGVMILLIPVLVLHGPGILRQVIGISSHIGIWSIAFQYMNLAIVNGMAFTSYNLASTFLLSRISVVHHAALNCIRRIFAVIVTSMVFGIPITFVGICGILVSFGGFMTFTHAKAKRVQQPKPMSSLLPTTVSTTTIPQGSATMIMSKD